MLSKRDIVRKSTLSDWSTALDSPSPRPTNIQLQPSNVKPLHSQTPHPTRHRNHEFHEAYALRLHEQDARCLCKLLLHQLVSKGRPSGHHRRRGREAWLTMTQSSRTPYQAYRSRFGPQYVFFRSCFSGVAGGEWGCGGVIGSRWKLGGNSEALYRYKRRNQQPHPPTHPATSRVPTPTTTPIEDMIALLRTQKKGY